MGGRRFASLLGALGIWLAAATARAQDTQITVVVVAPGASALDAEKLRSAVAGELHAEAVAADDPRAAQASGTVTIDVDRERGELVVSYAKRADAITRRVPLLPGEAATRAAAVALAGNLARNEASDLAAELRKKPSAPEPPKPKPLAPVRTLDSMANEDQPDERKRRLLATLDQYSREDSHGERYTGLGLAGFGAVAFGAGLYQDVRWKTRYRLPEIFGGLAMLDGVTWALLPKRLNGIAELAHAEVTADAIEQLWLREAQRERRLRNVEGFVWLGFGTLAIGAGSYDLLTASKHDPAPTSAVEFITLGAALGVVGGYFLATPGPIESALHGYERTTDRNISSTPTQSSVRVRLALGLGSVAVTGTF